MYIYRSLRLPFSRLNDELSNGSMTKLIPLLAGEFFKDGIERKLVKKLILATSIELNIGNDKTRQLVELMNLDDQMRRMTLADNELSVFKALSLVEQLADDDLTLICASDRLIETPDFTPNQLVLNTLSPDKPAEFSLKGNYFKFAFIDSIKKSKWSIFDETCEKFKIEKNEIDQYAHTSRVKYFTSVGNGRYLNEILPIKSTENKTGSYFLDGGLALNPSQEQYENANSVQDTKFCTQMNIAAPADGMVLLLVGKKKRKGLKPIAKISGIHESFGEPKNYIDVGANSVTKLATKTKVSLSEVDFFEIHENHPITPIALIKKLRVARKKVNMKGGSIATGDAMAASGARLISSACSILALSNKKKRKGIINLTCPSGNAASLLIESCD